MVALPARDSRSLSRAAVPGAAPPVQALYVHIPFCHSICPFCAFAVHGSRPGLHEPYVASLLRELSLADPLPEPGAVQSIYVGGGTPSTLAPGLVERLLRRIEERFRPAPGAEIAFEVNPEDAAADTLAALKAVGVTRISLGVQSLDDASLRALGRNHSALQAARAYEAAIRGGFENVNVDLMFGAPGIAAERFGRDVGTVATWRPAHVSLYGLDIEERTLFGRDANIRAWAADHREEQAAQYESAAEALAAAGYDHYEVSNFCLPGRAGRQNLLVWSGAGYLGFGLGAHSHVAGRRWANERHLAAYQARLAAGERPIAFEERLTFEQEANEALMLALRQGVGLEVAAWEARFGVRWGEQRTRTRGELVRRGLGTWEGGWLRLSRRGMLLADEITERLMVTGG